jgi:hypothetical protein
VSTSIPKFPRLVRVAAQLPARGRDLPAVDAIWRREVGEVVTDHRSSWVRRLSTPMGTVYVKTYEYPTWSDRWSALPRWTGPWARSRAAAEFDALAWLARQDLPGATPLAALEWRRWGCLGRATLITAACTGRPVSELMPELGGDDRRALARAIGVFVGRVHALGFRDRNLDLRNLVAHRQRGAWTVAKIDSPRHRLRPPGSARDRLVRDDWRRLLPQLEAFGVAVDARTAADGS